MMLWDTSNFHIEQGPKAGKFGTTRLEVVEAIVGQNRLDFTFFLGKRITRVPTPMNLRRDALAAAAEWVCGGREFGATTQRIWSATRGILRSEARCGRM